MSINSGRQDDPNIAVFIKTVALLNVRNRAGRLRFRPMSVEGTHFDASAKGAQAQNILDRRLRTVGSVSALSRTLLPNKQLLGPHIIMHCSSIFSSHSSRTAEHFLVGVEF